MTASDLTVRRFRTQAGLNPPEVPLSGGIFDLDGTLLDTIPIVLEAFRQAIVSVGGQPLSDHQIMPLFGPTEAGVLRQAVPDRWEEALNIYHREYQSLFVSRGISLISGLETALDLLKRSELPAAIVTGKSADSTAFSLESAGLRDAFEVVLTGSPDGEVKRDLMKQVLSRWKVSAEAVFYLGDSPSDLRDALSVGVIPLGAAWAQNADRASLEVERPQEVFSDTGAFIHWLKNHLGMLS